MARQCEPGPPDKDDQNDIDGLIAKMGSIRKAEVYAWDCWYKTARTKEEQAESPWPHVAMAIASRNWVDWEERHAHPGRNL